MIILNVNLARNGIKERQLFHANKILSEEFHFILRLKHSCFMFSSNYLGTKTQYVGFKWFYPAEEVELIVCVILLTKDNYP